MANIFKRIFGLETRKPQWSPAALPRSIEEDPAGNLLNQRIMAALGQGAGIGYGPEFEQRATSPMVTQLQADLPFQMRDIQEAYSARGLGRATPAVKDLGLARAQHGRDINQLIAQAYLTNLQQGKADIGRYEGLAGDIATKNLNLRTAAELQRQQEQLQDYQLGTQRDVAQTQGLNRLIGTAGTVGGAVLGPVGAAIGGPVGGFISAVGQGAGAVGGGFSKNVSSGNSSDFQAFLEWLKTLKT